MSYTSKKALKKEINDLHESYQKAISELVLTIIELEFEKELNDFDKSLKPKKKIAKKVAKKAPAKKTVAKKVAKKVAPKK